MQTISKSIKNMNEQKRKDYTHFSDEYITNKHLYLRNTN